MYKIGRDHETEPLAEGGGARRGLCERRRSLY